MEKRQITEEIEPPNQERIKAHGEKENFKYLGILEPDTIKQEKMKEKILKEYLRQTRKHLETKMCIRNLIKGINILAVPLVRYFGLFLKWIREEVRQINQRIRKLMMMHKVYIGKMTLTDYICQEKKEEEYSPELKIHQYEDSWTTLKRAKEG